MAKQAGSAGDIVIYESKDGLTRIDVVLDSDTVWLSFDRISQLFGRDKSTISRHLKNIFEEGELERGSVVAKNATTAADGKTYQVDYYNLDCIISVGYRVNSRQATAFRLWATGVLREYLARGFALYDERLKGNGGGSYWHELLDRIRDIRSSEKVLYRQVLDLCATAVDYDPRASESRLFFKTVQNKLGRETGDGGLLRVLSSIEGGFSLFIDAEWGQGKTVFARQLDLPISAMNPNITAPRCF